MTLSYSARSAYTTVPLAKQLFQLLDEKKTNLALTADVTSAQQLLELAQTFGPEICLLKTHIDILTDFTPTLITRLQTLAQQHRFLLFEDRKFADIGNTVLQQYTAGIYRIADWADIVNAHSLPGPGIIKALAQGAGERSRGLLLLAEMSSAGHLMDAHYMQKTLQLAKAHPDFVIGFITQHAVAPEPQWLNITPAVKFATQGDSLGQQYVTPEQAIIHNGADIIIVGRGILAAADPLAEAKRYRQAAWELYLKRMSS